MIFPQDRDIQRGIVAIVSYDYDYGWICEELQGREYEIVDVRAYDDPDHTEYGRQSAMRVAEDIVRNRGGKLLHHYEYPDAVREKHRSYTAWREHGRD